ncbi:hypothetical protein GQR58_029760 [Nymphon striatum]|nr:hypothetical protein GQR58_029760 [Nymphon striatum]
MSSVMPQPQMTPIVACTVSRDVQNFDLLIEDMEDVLGESWGDLGFAEALAFFGQPEAEAMEFVALAMDETDEDNLVLMTEIIEQAKSRDIKVILIAEDQAIQRVRAKDEPPVPEAVNAPTLKAGAQKDGALIVVHGLAGGTGSTTMAVNLAWELANVDKNNSPSVCLLDLDLQFGAVATFLDLPRREVVYEMLSETENMDEEIFGQALLTYEDTLQWSETVLNMAHIYFALVELDMRCAQNTLRFKRALLAEELPVGKAAVCVETAHPKFTDLNAKGRVKRMAESLAISIDVQLPDGGKPITQANDHGMPLANSAPKSPLRKELMKLAASIHDLKNDQAEAA